MTRERLQKSDLPEEVRSDRVLTWAEEISGDPKYHDNALLEHFMELEDRYLALLRRFLKIARISDGFQLSLKEINNLLDDAARKDYLTGLPNRRDIVEKIKSEISRAKRHGNPFSIVIADIDRFKEVNDSMGHEAGDLVLKSVSDLLRSSLRLEDHCARWGGEEFLICLPETNRSNAIAVAEKLRANVEHSTLAYQGRMIRVTISLGVSTHGGNVEVDDVIRDADTAMLAAKRGGRNRIEAVQ